MAEYIEREAVNKLLQKEIERTWHRVWGSVIWELSHKISQIPAADVVEVVHGEWTYLTYSGERLGGTDATYDYQCSVCNQLALEDSNYCPNCGADMRGETK